jgi:hypothetical protein
MTAQTLVVQTITSSVNFVTGSTKFGAISSNTHQFTGSLNVTGALYVATGSVGIGTVSPSQLFEVVGGEIKAGRVDTTNEGGQISFGRSTDNATAWYIDAFGNTTSPALRFVDAAASAVRMVLTGSNVGIGTATPDRLLQIYNTSGQTVFSIVGATNDSTDIFFGDPDNKAEAVIRFINGANTFNILQGGSTRMTITSAGLVGIGTNSPSGLLTVASTQSLALVRSTTTTNYAELQIENTTNYLQMGVEGASGNRMGGTIAYNAYLGSYANYGMTFHTNNSNRMTITNGGVVYINATSNPLPSNASPQFGVIAGAGTDAVNIKHTENGNNTLNLWQTGTTQHNAIAFYKGDSQTNRGNIVVTTSGTSYNSISDYRLKENIVPLENGLDRVLQIKPSKFNWIETGEESEGFIAHELQEVFPGAVTGEKDAVYSSTGNIKPQSVDYGRITPLLVKAIQELKAEIDALKAQ